MHIENEGKNENVWRRKWEGGGVKGAAAGENEEVPVDPANLRWKVAVAGDLFLVWLEHCAPEAGPGQLLLECLRNRRFCPSNDENHCPSICLSVCLPNRYLVLSYYFSSHSLSLSFLVSLFLILAPGSRLPRGRCTFVPLWRKLLLLLLLLPRPPFVLCPLPRFSFPAKREDPAGPRDPFSFSFLFLFISFSLSLSVTKGESFCFLLSISSAPFSWDWLARPFISLLSVELVVCMLRERVKDRFTGRKRGISFFF